MPLEVKDNPESVDAKSVSEEGDGSLTCLLSPEETLKEVKKRLLNISKHPGDPKEGAVKVSALKALAEVAQAEIARGKDILSESEKVTAVKVEYVSSKNNEQMTREAKIEESIKADMEAAKRNNA